MIHILEKMTIKDYLIASFILSLNFVLLLRFIVRRRNYKVFQNGTNILVTGGMMGIGK